ncbi:MAG: histidinol-phosphatase [Spirochaetaceae bacterium]|nr:MAG: histidinol-phosphatase [Spirochaetaceae bacterium]
MAETIWETHGIHVGTGKDHVKHGVDDVEAVVEQAIVKGFPSLSFVIHSPRLTSFRYQSERDTEVKFIRGDAAFFNYAATMEALKQRYRERIRLRYGIELEWMGPELGLQWNRSKLFQAYGVDFVIGSVHFSYQGIPYDGSKEDSKRLIELRGGLEPFWAGYLDEMIEMIDTSWEMIHVVGHLDLPKLYAPLPETMKDVENSAHYLARRMRTLLEMISDLNLALDVNLSGLRKGCGLYPDLEFLKRARQLHIPIAIGSDSHHVEEIGRDYARGLDMVREVGYRHYVTFSRGITEKRPLYEQEDGHFRILNLGVEILKLRFEPRLRQKTPQFSFGGAFRGLLEIFDGSVSLGGFNALRVRRDDRSITLSDSSEEASTQAIGASGLNCLYSHHTDTPGTLSILFNTLASEAINVETTQLYSLSDGTATAYLTVGGAPERIREAVAFVMGTASDRFFCIETDPRIELPPLKAAPAYLLEVDGVTLPIPISRQMVITVHNNSPGVLLILLSALASRSVNVLDLQLGSRGERGFAVLGIDGDEREVAAVLTELGPQFYEATQIVLPALELE